MFFFPCLAEIVFYSLDSFSSFTFYFAQRYLLFSGLAAAVVVFVGYIIRARIEIFVCIHPLHAIEPTRV